jgi:hypothetical protein
MYLRGNVRKKNGKQHRETLALFPEDHALPPDAVNADQVKVDQMQVREVLSQAPAQ